MATATCHTADWTPSLQVRVIFFYHTRRNLCLFMLTTLRAELSGAVYCYRSCLCVCNGSGGRALFVCGSVTTNNSKLHASIFIITCNITSTTRSTYGFCFIGHFADNFQYNYQTGTISMWRERFLEVDRPQPTHWGGHRRVTGPTVQTVKGAHCTQPALVPTTSLHARL